ncbi:MAG: hypothetical protein RLZZ276_1564, partial [Pseudomonadota bacterium]
PRALADAGVGAESLSPARLRVVVA